MFMSRFILFIYAICTTITAADLRVENRGDGWQLNSLNPTISDTPTNLKYFQFYDVLPNEINIKAFEDKDLTAVKDKKLFVGYGIADPSGVNCIVLKPENTGLATDTTICLPWWRIEREYKKSGEDGEVTNFNVFNNVRKPRPPLLVNVCESKQDVNYYPGGNISCTTYYDRIADDSCWTNPMQQKCFVDNCAKSITNDCTYKDTLVGDDTTLETAVTDKENGVVVPTQEETKISLATHIYSCQGGALSEECTKSQSVLMFPHECQTDDPATSEDDGEYIYCDEKQPIYSTSGSITGFYGKCASGEQVMCKVNSFTNTSAECTEPIYENYEKFTNYEYETKRTYNEVSVDALSGETDSYSANESCLRSNTIEDSRDKEMYVKISGSGSLDDDIYVLRHEEGGNSAKIYCNMQHAGASASMGTNLNSCLVTKGFSKTITAAMSNSMLSCVNDPNNFGTTYITSCMKSMGYTVGSLPTDDLTSDDMDYIYDCGENVKGGSATKIYDGTPLSCLRNNGSYSFNDTVRINSTDLVTVQQNSEQEMYTGTPFAVGRNHYSSSKVVIDNVEVAPAVTTSSFPYYPSNSSHLRTWDNTTATFSILFPFASAYELYFYNKNGAEIAMATIDLSDFKEIPSNNSLNLKLGKSMPLASGISESNAGRTDPWVEWGGGVYGGKESITGGALASPVDSYVVENAATSVIIKDLITGAITPIAFVYPLPYPNRIFLSKLKVYEHRKYRCYNNFELFTPPSSRTTNKFVCSTNSDWTDYLNGYNTSADSVPKWDDTAMCEQNCFTQNSCSAVTYGGQAAFTCGARGGENLGGDLGGNYFTNAAQCNTQCKVSNSCESYSESNCETVEESFDTQAQDFTGKALYTKKQVTYRCSENRTKQVGCGKFNYTVTEGEVNLSTAVIGYETKDYSNLFENAITKADMLDVGSQHIWSGWQGKCVIGMKMDASYLSDPMTIASYAMSAYQSYTQLNGQSLFSEMKAGDFGDTIKGGAQSIQDGMDTAYDNTFGAAGKFFTPDAGGGTTTTPDANTGGGSGGGTTTTPKPTTTWWNDVQIHENGMLWKNVTNGDFVMFGVSSAMEILAPSEQEFELAQKLLDPFSNEADVSVQAYNSCLSSIGLSYPAVVGYSFDESDAMSNELIAPWEHPLRVTTEELQSLVSSMGESYVKKAYLYNSDNININLLASNAEAYLKVGQIICAGHKVSQTMDYISVKREQVFPEMGGGSNAGMATSVAISAIGMMNPVLGFAMKVAVDLYSNMLVKINTCENEAEAIARDLLEYKTNKFNKNGLCKQTRTYCDKYMNFGFVKKCVRDGYDFCCYDKATTRIFAESLKEQLDQNWDNCQGITINDLKDISFRECRAGEVPSINKCIATDKFDEYKKTLFQQATRGVSVEGLAEQVINAIQQE